ncbi:hypothetical protein Bbelb_415850 [Branchiostoma belcheri]|nr:hypothetical protein Bbelb_415850 [Branchiostoma belcheri]
MVTVSRKTERRITVETVTVTADGHRPSESLTCAPNGFTTDVLALDSRPKKQGACHWKTDSVQNVGPHRQNGRDCTAHQYCAPTVTTRRTCFCLLSTCKNVGNRTASVRAYERATYGLREFNFTILTCDCCTDSARSTCVPRTVLASSVLTPHFPVDLLNDHAEHTCTIPVYKDNLTGDCQLVSKMPRKAQKETTKQDPKKRAAEDTRAASDDEVNRRCTHLQRASTACTRQHSNRTEIVRCRHVQLTYNLRNVRCTQPLTARRVVQSTYVHLAQPYE